MERAGLEARYTSLVRHISERAISIIAVENVAPKLRDEQIRVAVIIVVPPYASHAIASARDTSFCRDVGEGAIAIVPIQCVAGRNSAVVKVTSVDKINVLPAVAVKVGDAYPWAELLAINRNSVRSLVMRELNSCLCGDVRELNSGRTLRDQRQGAQENRNDKQENQVHELQNMPDRRHQFSQPYLQRSALERSSTHCGNTGAPCGGLPNVIAQCSSQPRPSSPTYVSGRL